MDFINFIQRFETGTTFVVPEIIYDHPEPVQYLSDDTPLRNGVLTQDSISTIPHNENYQ